MSVFTCLWLSSRHGWIKQRWKSFTCIIFPKSQRQVFALFWIPLRRKIRFSPEVEPQQNSINVKHSRWFWLILFSQSWPVGVPCGFCSILNLANMCLEKLQHSKCLGKLNGQRQLLRVNFMAKIPRPPQSLPVKMVSLSVLALNSFTCHWHLTKTTLIFHLVILLLRSYVSRWSLDC